jgi:uncharacterized protein DUF3761
VHRAKVRTAYVAPAPAPKPPPRPVVHRWSEAAAEGRLYRDLVASDIECTGVDTPINGEYHRLNCLVDYGDGVGYEAGDIVITGAHRYRDEMRYRLNPDDEPAPDYDRMPSDPAPSEPITPEPINPDDYSDHDGTYNGAPTTQDFGDGAGSVGLCADGTYSDSVGRQGACSHHGGVG